MSLILDALKKVERERDNPDQVVVVGSVPWQGVRRSRLVPILAVLVVLAAFAALGSWLVLERPIPRRERAATAPARPAAAVTSPPPVPSPAAPTTAPAIAPRAVTRPPAPTPRPVLKAGVPTAERPSTAPRAAAPAAPPADAAVGLQLMAISSQDGQPVAVISGRVVREGDRFDGIHVVHIGEAEVELEVRGRRRVLRF